MTLRISHVRVSNHAVERAQERLGWGGGHDSVSKQVCAVAVEALGADPPRKAVRRPAWAAPPGGKRRRASKASRGVYRYLWNERQTVALVAHRIRGRWEIVTTIARESGV